MEIGDARSHVLCQFVIREPFLLSILQPHGGVLIASSHAWSPELPAQVSAISVGATYALVFMMGMMAAHMMMVNLDSQAWKLTSDQDGDPSKDSDMCNWREVTPLNEQPKIYDSFYNGRRSWKK